MANKCAVASRIDCFSEGPQTTLFGEKLKQQMEERLNFLATGAKPKKNTDAMKEVLDELRQEGLYYEAPQKTKKSKKVEEDEESEVEKKQKKDKKKKDKKRKQRDSDDEEEVEQPKKKKMKV